MRLRWHGLVQALPAVRGYALPVLRGGVMHCTDTGCDGAATYALLLTESPPMPGQVEDVPRPTHYRTCRFCGEMAIQQDDGSWRVIRRGRRCG